MSLELRDVAEHPTMNRTILTPLVCLAKSNNDKACQPEGQSKGPQVGEGRSWELRCRATLMLRRGSTSSALWSRYGRCSQLHRKEREWGTRGYNWHCWSTSQVSKEYLSLKNESVNTWQHKSLQVTVFVFPALALNRERGWNELAGRVILKESCT